MSEELVSQKNQEGIAEKDIWERLNKFSLKAKKSARKSRKTTDDKSIEIERSKQLSQTSSRSMSSNKKIREIEIIESKEQETKDETVEIYSSTNRVLLSKLKLKITKSSRISTLIKASLVSSIFERTSKTASQSIVITSQILQVSPIESIPSTASKKVINRRKKMKDDFNIKAFWNKRDEKKDLEKYLKDIKFVYQTNYKTQKTWKKDTDKYKNNVHKILFRQNLRDDVENWYSDLKKSIKSDWTALQSSFKTQFEIEANVEADKYLLLQRVVILTQRLNESIADYFRRTKSLIRHLSSSTKIIDYNVIKEMKNKIQRKRVNFECNKNRNFSLKKIKLIMQAAYQTMNTMSSFDSEWNHSKDPFNHNKEKKKALSSEEWNQQILSSILQDIRNIVLKSERKNKTKEKDEQKEAKSRQSEAFISTTQSTRNSKEW